MENSQIIDSGYSSESTGLSLNSQTLGFLDEIRKWSKFLSIVGFITIGLIALMGLFMGSFMGTMLATMGNNAFPAGSSAAFTVVYLLLALVYFFPVLYLFKFSKSLGTALSNGDNEDLTQAFSNLKSIFKFIGIVTIVILSIYGIIIVGALLVGVAMR